MSPHSRSPNTMQTSNTTAVKLPADCSTFDRSLTHLCYFLHACRFFYCNLHKILLHNYTLQDKMPKRKGGKTVYSATEAVEMVCMNSDSEGDDIDLGEDFESMALSSDNEDDIEFEDNNSDDENEESCVSPPKKKGNFYLY